MRAPIPRISGELAERFLAPAFSKGKTRGAMADAQECRRQAAECNRLSKTDVSLESKTIMRNMAKSWVALANQMDRLDHRDPEKAAHLGLAR